MERRRFCSHTSSPPQQQQRTEERPNQSLQRVAGALLLPGTVALPAAHSVAVSPYVWRQRTYRSPPVAAAADDADGPSDRPSRLSSAADNFAECTKRSDRGTL